MNQRTAPKPVQLTIGSLSRRAAVKIETVRYYERVGLLPAPPRTEGGHRLYGEPHVKRLTFVRRARELGFTLEEIRALLRLVDERPPSCARARTLATKHLTDVREKIADLKRMERVLTQTVALCEQGDRPECPLLEALFRENGSGVSAQRSRRGAETD
ncbi:MerR family mercuric resistance operon transcriptional regulator [Povalibacter uvarum]|uniref:MerR family mercuric resistance operon transcriptional regulator n=1 Tax=Povalibacter uvarum TaxID=732238 RepID=A0A841HSD7_9GAMM|nr:helix-turn-helix domain-containing protein [Povalibacter uvarum]MBB6094958.1 MerR family mercuric resistance operon transcriptional regulator [Povalibacter uvarum]